MCFLSKLFKPGMIRAKVGHRVQHTNTKKLGTVLGRARIHGTIKVWVLTVKYDDGTLASQVPENEFIPMGKSAAPVEKPDAPHLIVGQPRELGNCLQCRRREDECTCPGGPWLGQA